MSEERTYTNQNLAGILSLALGLEGGDSRASFSGTHRETLRTALEDASSPATFQDLLETLRQLEANPSTIRAVQEHAASHPERSLQEFAVSFGRND